MEKAWFSISQKHPWDKDAQVCVLSGGWSQEIPGGEEEVRQGGRQLLQAVTRSSAALDNSNATPLGSSGGQKGTHHPSGEAKRELGWICITPGCHGVMSAGYKLCSTWVLCVGDRLPFPDRNPQAEAQLFSEADFPGECQGRRQGTDGVRNIEKCGLFSSWS